MREIKFRAWNKSDGMRKIGVEISSYIDYWKIMQFTGLKDKNGKDIYEGDIVKPHPNDELKSNNKRTGIVVYSKTHMAFMIDKDLSYKYFVHADHKPFELEVIGNIYENPELIKKCDKRGKNAK